MSSDDSARNPTDTGAPRDGLPPRRARRAPANEATLPPIPIADFGGTSSRSDAARARGVRPTMPRRARGSHAEQDTDAELLAAELAASVRTQTTAPITPDQTTSAPDVAEPATGGVGSHEGDAELPAAGVSEQGLATGSPQSEGAPEISPQSEGAPEMLRPRDTHERSSVIPELGGACAEDALPRGDHEASGGAHARQRSGQHAKPLPPLPDVSSFGGRAAGHSASAANTADSEASTDPHPTNTAEQGHASGDADGAFAPAAPTTRHRADTPRGGHAVGHDEAPLSADSATRSAQTPRGSEAVDGATDDAARADRARREFSPRRALRARAAHAGSAGANDDFPSAPTFDNTRRGIAQQSPSSEPPWSSDTGHDALSSRGLQEQITSHLQPPTSVPQSRSEPSGADPFGVDLDSTPQRQNSENRASDLRGFAPADLGSTDDSPADLNPPALEPGDLGPLGAHPLGTNPLDASDPLEIPSTSHTPDTWDPASSLDIAGRDIASVSDGRDVDVGEQVSATRGEEYAPADDSAELPPASAESDPAAWPQGRHESNNSWQDVASAEGSTTESLNPGLIEDWAVHPLPVTVAVHAAAADEPVPPAFSPAGVITHPHPQPTPSVHTGPNDDAAASPLLSDANQEIAKPDMSEQPQQFPAHARAPEQHLPEQQSGDAERARPPMPPLPGRAQQQPGGEDSARQHGQPSPFPGQPQQAQPQQAQAQQAQPREPQQPQQAQQPHASQGQPQTQQGHQSQPQQAQPQQPHQGQAPQTGQLPTAQPGHRALHPGQSQPVQPDAGYFPPGGVTGNPHQGAGQPPQPQHGGGGQASMPFPGAGGAGQLQGNPGQLQGQPTQQPATGQHAQAPQPAFEPAREYTDQNAGVAPTETIGFADDGGMAMPAPPSGPRRAPGFGAEVESSKGGPGNKKLNMHAAMEDMLKAGASDLHITVDVPPMVRIHGALQPLDGYAVLEKQDIQEALYQMMSQRQRETFEEVLEMDFSYQLPGSGRFRVNVFRQRDALGAVLRQIPTELMTLEQLGIPEVAAGMSALPRGLVLVTGPTGSGKSTTLAAMVDIANRTRQDHIVTIEDPIEFVHTHKECVVNQREIGEDSLSFAAALKHALRQDVDIILVGEMRDLETISAALTAAETGHLVMGTLHTQDAPQTVERIVDVFPPEQQQQVRTMLAGSLMSIVAQTLCPTADGKGRVAASEILVVTPAIRNLIREGKVHQIKTSMQAGQKFGMQTMDQSLARLARAGKITMETGLSKCSSEEDFKRLASG